MNVQLIKGSGYASNCYYVQSGKDAILIDPSVSYEETFSQLGGSVPIPERIVLTHAHFDHMLYLNEWREKTNAKLALHAYEAPALKNPNINLYGTFLSQAPTFAAAEILLAEDDLIMLGDECLRVLHTPGHTVGAICLVGESAIFTGDTVFTDGGYGRTDFFGGNEQCLWNSILRLRAIKTSAIMYPGHGPSGSFQSEMQYFSLL